MRQNFEGSRESSKKIGNVFEIFELFCDIKKFEKPKINYREKL